MDDIWVLQVHSHEVGYYVVVYNFIESELVEIAAEDNEPTPEQLWSILRECMIGVTHEENRRPAKLVVHDEQLLTLWAERFEQLGVELVCDPEIVVPDDLVEELNRVMEKVDEQVQCNDETMEAVQRLERSDEVWHVGVFQTPIWIHDSATPRRSNLAIVMDEESESIRIHDLSAEKPSPDFLAKTVLKGMLYPLSSEEEGVIPAKILVHPHTNIEMIRKLADDLEIELDRLDDDAHSLLDKAIYHLIVHCSDSTLRESLIDSAQLSIDQLRSFYQDVTRFYQSAPWTKVATDRLIKISRSPSAGRDVYVSVVGQGGLHCGVIASFDGDGMKSIIFDNGEDDGRVEVMVLNFGEAHEIAPIDLWMIEQHDFDVANANAYPTIQQSLANHQYRRPQRESMTALQLTLLGIPRF